MAGLSFPMSAALMPYAAVSAALDGTLSGFNANGLSPEDFAQLYPEYNALAGSCRFQPCLHDREPGCAVHAAVDAGELGAARWTRYRELLTQVRENWKGRYE